MTAIFGLTVAREDDALRAVRAADELRARRTSSSVSASRPAKSWPARTIGPAPLLSGARSGSRPASRARPRVKSCWRRRPNELVRGATSTQPVPRREDDDGTGSSAVRLVALTEGRDRPPDDHAVRRPCRRTRQPGRRLRADRSEGTPGLVTVIGAPGVGKSRLVAEAFARIAERATILRSRCLPYGDGITYWPVRELVFAAAGIGPGEPRADASPNSMQSSAGRTGPGSSATGSRRSSGGRRPVPAEEIRWAVRRFFEALAAERPLVLLVDDLQWAEPRPRRAARTHPRSRPRAAPPGHHRPP